MMSLDPNRDSYYNNSSFRFHANQAGADLNSVSVDAPEGWMTHAHSFNITYTFRVQLDKNIHDADDFEEAFLKNSDYDQMKRIINSNPELKLLYDHYKIIDKLSGK
jgi:hypothetical protein